MRSKRIFRQLLTPEENKETMGIRPPHEKRAVRGGWVGRLTGRLKNGLASFRTKRHKPRNSFNAAASVPETSPRRVERTIFGEPLRGLGNALLDLCLPRMCAGCGEKWLLHHEGFWCEDCLDALSWIRSPICPECGRPFLKSPSSPDHLCGECLLDAFSFDTARSAVQHAGVVRRRIHQLKFGAQLHWVPPLVVLLLQTLEQECLSLPELVLPVPLHVHRLRERGFNQAGLLAKALARRVGLPVQFALLLRKHKTQPQTRLHRTQRLQNVRGAFGVSRPHELEGRRILLVDDVFTTGTTLSECAKVLKESGAASVHALTVSRALPEVRQHDGGLGEQAWDTAAKRVLA